MIALITPTGGRPAQINLCAEFMRRQDYTGKVLWVLVDDVVPETIDCIGKDFKKDWQIVKVYPVPCWEFGQNTQARNLLEGIEIVKNHKDIELIFVIEDDDYYSPRYLSTMSASIGGYDVVGEIGTIYYNVLVKGWRQHMNEHHSSLFQLAFKPNMIDAFVGAVKYQERFIDIMFFKQFVPANKVKFIRGGNLSIGIKGMPGRPGIGRGHLGKYRYYPDPDCLKLKELIGEDYKYYESANICNRSRKIR